MAAIGSAARKPHSPVPMILVGIVAVVIWGYVTLLRIATSEAFFLGHPSVTFRIGWYILWQVPDMMQGKLTPLMNEATVWGWGIETVYLICVVGLEVAHEFVTTISPTIGRVFHVAMAVILLLDGISDFQYISVPGGWMAQVGFSLLSAFIVFYFGTTGWRFIESGVKEIMA
jgi:hypothetical protein